MGHEIIFEELPFKGEVAALFAALIWAFSVTVFTMYGHGIAPRILNLYKNIVATLGLLAAAIIFHEPFPESREVWLLLIASGIIGLSIGDTAAFGALYRIGVRVTSAIQCLSPPLTSLFAFIFLGEILKPQQILGMTITLLAIVSIVWIRNRDNFAVNVSQHDHYRGLVLAVVAALCQAIGVTLARKAFQETSAITGTFIRMISSVLVLSLSPLVFHARSTTDSLIDVIRLRGKGVALTVASFAGTCVGITLSSVALKFAKAGVASALMATFPLWVIVVTRVVQKETIQWSVSLLTLVAVGGIALMFLQ